MGTYELTVVYQNVKSIQLAYFKLPRSQTIYCIGYNVNLPNCCGGHLEYHRRPKTNRVQGLCDIKAKSKYKVNQISGFQDITFTSNSRGTDGQMEGRTDRQPNRRTDSRMDRAIL